MIKVLHFVSVPARWSGVMSVIMNYYRHLDRSRIQFDFLCFIHCDDSYEEEIEKLGGRVFFISKPNLNYRSEMEIKRFFSQHQGEYQWLHNHEVYLSFFLKPLVARYGISKFIVHCHATQYSDRKFPAIRNCVLCLPIRFMECERFACSKAAAIFLYGRSMVEEGRVVVIPNAIDCRKFRFDVYKREELREQLEIKDEEIVIGHVGRFTKQKNHELLFNIFYECCKESSRLKLLCVGDGVLQEEMKKKAIQLNIADRVIFAGQRNDVNDLLNTMDVFMLPSYFEGFPVSMVEAYCNGLPCIVSSAIADELKEEKIFRIALDAPIDNWKSEIFKQIGKRQSEVNMPEEFDIYKQAKKLESIYLGEKKII